MHKLTSPNFIDPRWFNLMRQEPQEGVAIDNTTIKVNGEMLALVEPTITLVPGEKVIVTLTRNLAMETAKEAQERIERQRQAYQAEEQRRREEEARKNAENKQFNASLNIPVRWKPAIKDVLSGLSENSMGNGCNKATVIHVYLLEVLNDGKLHRSERDFLCTSEHGSNGKNWSGQREEDVYMSNGEVWISRVTCKACLKLAQRWIGKE